MIDTIHLHVDRADGSLQRVIGLIERRGFSIERMIMEGGTNTHRAVAICVSPRDAGRHVDVLNRQIDRLFGVSRTDAYDFVQGEGRAQCVT